MGTEKTLRCAVIGVGRMGRHHARVYAHLEGAEFVGVVDSNKERRDDVVEEWGGRAYETVDEMIDAGVDAVTIATPTVYHLEAAAPLLERGIACLIEKPLAPTTEVASAIADAAEEGGAVLQVGHVVRYDPVMRAIASIENLRPRFIEMTRISPMTFRSTDVGVVLDMMIHDLDVLTMLLGNEPTDIYANFHFFNINDVDVINRRQIFAFCKPMAKFRELWIVRSFLNERH